MESEGAVACPVIQLAAAVLSHLVFPPSPAGSGGAPGFTSDASGDTRATGPQGSGGARLAGKEEVRYYFIVHWRRFRYLLFNLRWVTACAAVRGVLRIARSQEVTGVRSQGVRGGCRSSPRLLCHQENLLESQGTLGRWKVAYYQ